MTSAARRALSLTLVRHGESDWNVSRLVQGQNDEAHLSKVGRAQARRLVEGLRAQAFHHVVSSDLARARETAVIIADALTLTTSTDPLLRERCFGTLEGGPLTDLTSAMTGVADGVVIDPDARPLGGESFRDVVRRAELFVDKVSGEGSDGPLLIVTHGGMIRALRAQCSGAPLERLTWDPVGNASVWTVRTTEVR